MSEIPQSAALEEAKTDSLSVLLTKDPFEFTRQDRDKVVAALRAQRLKWEEAEKSGAVVRHKRTATAAKSLLKKKKTAEVSPEE